MFQLHPYFFVLAFSALATLSVIIIVWKRTAPGAFVLKVMLLGMFIWSGSYAMTWLVVPLQQKIFWLKATYLGVVVVPTCFLLFTLFLTNREKWITFRNLLLLGIEPALVVLLVWLAPRAFFASIQESSWGEYVFMEIQRGVWFWIHLFYSYLLVLLGFTLLVTSYRQANAFFKKQYLMILLGSVVPFLFSAFTHLRTEGSSDPDYAPMTFGIAGMVYAYAIFRHKFMDLVPFARSHLIEKMSDGLVVVDAQGRIVDINPAMRTFLDADPVSFLGKNISDILTIWNDRFEHLMNGPEIRTEMRLPHKPSRYLDLRVTPLYDDDHTLSGRLIVFRDITDRKEVEKDLRHAMDRMQTQLIEIGLLQSQLREQAIRDALTNLFNRRYLEETLERELARAAREVYPLCIVMMDTDHFKEVNDTYGHEAGDIVLKTLAETVTSQSRQGDFVCRYGGEEFVLVMPNISLEVARERVGSLHRSISSLYIPFGRFSLNVTVSMGVSAFPLHGEKKEELLRAADRALYAAKHAGRNRVMVYRELEKNE
ncbi:MAG: diguanylate cyclase [Chloroflexota bacterium]